MHSYGSIMIFRRSHFSDECTLRPTGEKSSLFVPALNTRSAAPCEIGNRAVLECAAPNVRLPTSQALPAGRGRGTPLHSASTLTAEPETRNPKTNSCPDPSPDTDLKVLATLSKTENQIPRRFEKESDSNKIRRAHIFQQRNFVRENSITLQFGAI